MKTLTDRERRIRMPEVTSITGLSKRTIYRRIDEGLFPAPLKDGGASLWLLSEVLHYINTETN